MNLNKNNSNLTPIQQITEMKAKLNDGIVLPQRRGIPGMNGF